MNEPIDSIKTFDILDEPDEFENDADEIGFDWDDTFADLKYRTGQTDRHGIPLDLEYWEEV